MIRCPDMLVRVEGGVAEVQVNRSYLIAELRDYDVEGTDAGHPELWTDEDGKTCLRRYITGDQSLNVHEVTANGLKRFAEHLEAHAGLAAKLDLADRDDGLHVIQIKGVDFYFNANGTGYDGWGQAINPPGRNSP